MNAFERRRRQLAEERKVERLDKRAAKEKAAAAKKRSTQTMTPTPEHPPASKVIDLGETLARHTGEETAAQIRAALSRPQTPVPQAELDLLERVALGDTGQSRSVRYLLFLLPGAQDPAGFKGEGLLELRALDRALADAFLKVLDWWRGPTRSDEPLHRALARIEAAFPAREDNR